MTWRELVFEICNKIPDEQFDDEAKMCVNGMLCEKVTRVTQNTTDWYQTKDGVIRNDQILDPIIKQFEFTLQ